MRQQMLGALVSRLSAARIYVVENGFVHFSRLSATMHRVTADYALEEVLRLARDPALSDDALRHAVRAVIERLAPDECDAAILRARELLTEQRPLH